MAKRVGGQSIEDQLRDFEAAPGLPKNLGNFPDELETAAQIAVRPAAPEAPVEPEDDEPEAVAEPVDATPQGEPETEEPVRETAAERRIRELDERLAARDREIALLRAGSPVQAAPVAQPQPADGIALIDRFLGGYQVTPEDVQTILQDPQKGAEYLQNGLRAAVGAAFNMAVSHVRDMYQQDQASRQDALSLREYFYSTNPDLANYAEVVGIKATALKAQYPNATREALCAEVAKQTREQLKTWGVDTRRASANAPRQTRSREVRPAYGDMGGRGSGGGPRRAQTPIEKQLREFEAATNHYRG